MTLLPEVYHERHCSVIVEEGKTVFRAVAFRLAVVVTEEKNSANLPDVSFHWEPILSPGEKIAHMQGMRI